MRAGGPKRWRPLAAAAAVVLVAAVAAGLLLGRSHTSTGADASAGGSGAGAAHAGPADPVHITVAPGPGGRAIPAGFLGLSFEFEAVRAYTGSDPRRINPVLVQLIRNLSPGQPPVLRIGGDSTDSSYVPASGVRPPAYLAYRLGPGWMATTAALAHQLRARTILGVNLAARDPALARAEARGYLRAFGAGTVAALEIGNEPNLYGKVTKFRTAAGGTVRARPPDYAYPAFRREFHSIAAALPRVPLLAPALAEGPIPGRGSWVRSMPGFLAGDQRVATLTLHRYPLRNCNVAPRSPQYPSIPHLLAPYATSGLAASMGVWVRIAHRRHGLVRDDELNSVACRGKVGVSDTFASALWATNALFALARAGVDGVNVHSLPGAAYGLFQFRQRAGRWSAAVRPAYYGLQMFAQAAPAGSRMVSLGRPPGGGLSAWATHGRDGRLRVVLVNTSPRSARSVSLSLPADTLGAGGSTATVERLSAPSVAARDGITLGGSGYGQASVTGELGVPRLTTIAARGGTVTVAVPASSAALVTVGG